MIKEEEKKEKRRNLCHMAAVSEQVSYRFKEIQFHPRMCLPWCYIAYSSIKVESILSQYRDRLPRKNYFLTRKSMLQMKEDEEINVLDVSIHNLSVAGQYCKISLTLSDRQKIPLYLITLLYC